MSIRSASWLPSMLAGHLQAHHIFFRFDREIFLHEPPVSPPSVDNRLSNRRAAPGNGTAFSAVAPSEWQYSPPIDPIFGSGIAMISPAPNTCRLNIQPLGQFRPHRGFLLARSTLPSSVARLLHTAGFAISPTQIWHSIPAHHAAAASLVLICSAINGCRCRAGNALCSTAQ
jgi:hypothetical protein